MPAGDGVTITAYGAAVSTSSVRDDNVTRVFELVDHESTDPNGSCTVKINAPEGYTSIKYNWHYGNAKTTYNASTGVLVQYDADLESLYFYLNPDPNADPMPEELEYRIIINDPAAGASEEVPVIPT